MERKIFIPLYLSCTIVGILIGITNFKSIPIILAILAGVGLGEVMGVFLCILIIALSKLLKRN